MLLTFPWQRAVHRGKKLPLALGLSRRCLSGQQKFDNAGHHSSGERDRDIPSNIPAHCALQYPHEVHTTRGNQELLGERCVEISEQNHPVVLVRYKHFFIVPGDDCRRMCHIVKRWYVIFSSLAFFRTNILQITSWTARKMSCLCSLCRSCLCSLCRPCLCSLCYLYISLL